MSVYTRQTDHIPQYAHFWLRKAREGGWHDRYGRSTVDALKSLLSLEEFEKSPIKAILTKHSSPGIMSMMDAYSQEALYRARIHPKRKPGSLSEEELLALHAAIREVTCDATAAGGRASERDLFDRPGGFVAAVSRETEGKPCPVCGTAIEAINMGGAGKYYICPGCQAR